MNLDQYLIVYVTTDMKNYCYQVMDKNARPGIGMADGRFIEAPNAAGNRTTSKSTLGTNIQNEMPTLGT